MAIGLIHANQYISIAFHTFVCVNRSFTISCRVCQKCYPTRLLDNSLTLNYLRNKSLVIENIRYYSLVQFHLSNLQPGEGIYLSLVDARPLDKHLLVRVPPRNNLAG